MKNLTSPEFHTHKRINDRIEGVVNKYQSVEKLSQIYTSIFFHKLFAGKFQHIIYVKRCPAEFG